MVLEIPTPFAYLFKPEEQMIHNVSREVRLKKWPQGVPVADDFEIVETAIAEPAEGEVLVRNICMSVDPYMRGRLRPGKSYVSSFQLDNPLDGGCIGVVEESKNSAFSAGDHVLSGRGFREKFVSDGKDLAVFDKPT